MLSDPSHSACRRTEHPSRLGCGHFVCGGLGEDYELNLRVKLGIGEYNSYVTMYNIPSFLTSPQ